MTETPEEKFRGLVQVYTGNGKGKTTAAFGLSLRALGQGFKVCIVQFMKGNTTYGETQMSGRIEGITLFQFGRADFVDPKNPLPVDYEEAQKALNKAREAFAGSRYDLVILDEVNVALHFKLISIEDVLSLVTAKPEAVELVLTGRYAPKEIIERADLVTEMKEIKHPFQIGVNARKGIEY
ncbi:MAG: cob(I)yrinic acid a,c-diamide adenosyltransferase [Candidatus Xenobiia bacterium LiM19]